MSCAIGHFDQHFSSQHRNRDIIFFLAMCIYLIWECIFVNVQNKDSGRNIKIPMAVIDSYKWQLPLFLSTVFLPIFFFFFVGWAWFQRQCGIQEMWKSRYGDFAASSGKNDISTAIPVAGQQNKHCQSRSIFISCHLWNICCQPYE